jgi:transposase-like protein
MSKNMIQFQPGLSLTAFLKQYGTEELCRAALYEWHWPKGYVCPQCGYHSACKLKNRQLYQCNRCHHQSSVIAGTIFQDTKLPLTVWFLGSYFLTQSKNGISALALSRHLGLSYNAAWRIKHKLMQVMLERDNSKPLQGRVELDDSYWGGERRGGKRGRGAEAKKPFVGAVQSTEDEKPLKMKLSAVTGFQSEKIGKWSHTTICWQEARWSATDWRVLTPFPRPIASTKCILSAAVPRVPSTLHFTESTPGLVMWKMPRGAPIIPFEISLFPTISPSFPIDLTAAMTYRALFRDFSMWLFAHPSNASAASNYG